jgi:RNA polymerase alpha subunit
MSERLPDDMPVGKLELSVRAANCLAHSTRYTTDQPIATVGELRRTPDPELLRFPNFGRVSLKEVRALVPYDPTEYAPDFVGALRELLPPLVRIAKALEAIESVANRFARRQGF